jgi:hypothetical protein
MADTNGNGKGKNGTVPTQEKIVPSNRDRIIQYLNQLKQRQQQISLQDVAIKCKVSLDLATEVFEQWKVDRNLERSNAMVGKVRSRIDENPSIEPENNLVVQKKQNEQNGGGVEIGERVSSPHDEDVPLTHAQARMAALVANAEGAGQNEAAAYLALSTQCAAHYVKHPEQLPEELQDVITGAEMESEQTYDTLKKNFTPLQVLRKYKK